MRELIRRLTRRQGQPAVNDAPSFILDDLEAQAEAAATYRHMIGADLSLDERRLRGKALAAGVPRNSFC